MRASYILRARPYMQFLKKFDKFFIVGSIDKLELEIFKNETSRMDQNRRFRPDRLEIFIVFTMI